MILIIRCSLVSYSRNTFVGGGVLRLWTGYSRLILGTVEKSVIFHGLWLPTSFLICRVVCPQKTLRLLSVVVDTRYMEYSFSTITPRSTLSRSDITCLGSKYGSNKNVQSVSREFYYWLFETRQLCANY